MTVRLLHAAVPASVFLNRFQALGANYHNVCARRARVPNRWKLLFHNWTAWSQTCHARTFNAFSVPTVVTCWVPNCPSRCFFERPPICLYTLEETAEGRDTRGGFQKQGTFMTSDDDETLEYKKAKMGIVFTCATCETRVTRIFSKRSYEKGVVIVRVEQEHGCKREDGGTHCLHLISDNLGWFEDNPVNVEIMAARRGERVERIKVTDSSPGAQAPGSTNPTAQAQQAHDRAIVVKEDDGEVLQMYLDDSATDYGGRPDEEAPPG